MRKVVLGVVPAVALALSACTTTEQMDWVMVGGGKADGSVILGIDVPAKMGITETNIEYNIDQANAEADRRCKNWGYSGSDMYKKGQFPILKTCIAQGISPCWSKTYRIQYQCVGNN